MNIDLKSRNDKRLVQELYFKRAAPSAPSYKTPPILTGGVS